MQDEEIPIQITFEQFAEMLGERKKDRDRSFTRTCPKGHKYLSRNTRTKKGTSEECPKCKDERHLALDRPL